MTVAAFALGALLQRLAWATFAVSPLFSLSILPLFVAGIGQAGFHTMRNVILLTTASNAMRGRAMSGVALRQGIGLPAELLTGSLGEPVGPRFTVALQASIAALSSLLAALTPDRRRARRDPS